MSVINLKNIYKVYDGGVKAVVDFNLTVRDKEFVVFVGPSGCGKSTTLRMIAGLEKITAGDIYIDNARINDMEPRDRDIAMVFQNYALYPHMTVYKNMAFSLKIKKTKMPVYEDTRIKEIIKELGSLNKRLKKEKDNSKVEEIKKQVLVLEEELKFENENKKQKYFIDEKAIKDTELSILFYQKQIENLKNYIEKCNKKLANQELTIEKQNEINLIIDKCERKINDFTNTIEAEEKNLDYLKNNEVPMYQLTHLSKEEIDVRVKEAARMLEIEDLLDRKPRALSGGQRQRVAIGRAIVRNAKVFLMDEPLSNLDAKLRNQMRAELILLRKKINTTFIYVTHDQTEAMTLGDRIVIMKDGYIQQIGTPQQLFNHPANLFVAGFIGSPQMNFINASIDDELKINVLGKKIVLSEKKKEALTKENVKAQDIVIGIRPEHLNLASEENEFALKGKITVVELMGSSLHVHIDTEAEKNLVMIIPTANYSEEEISKIVAGNDICFTWNSNLQHLFSMETKENLIYFKNND